MLSGLDLTQLKTLIVRPTLVALDLSSPAAENLLTGTALSESMCAYLHQVGGGPALGLWQMEPATHNDCWTNYLNFQADLAARVKSLMSAEDPLIQLVSNLRYACAMARIKYVRADPALPAANDAAGLSAYHKAWYNSSEGAANAAREVTIFAQAIAS